MKVETGDRATNRLYAAIIAYIEKNHGSVVVIGGIEIQEWTGQLEFNNQSAILHYTVGVKVEGRRPMFDKPTEGGPGA